MTDEELIEKYKAEGGTITKIKHIKDSYQPYTGNLIPSSKPIRKDVYGKRIYRNSAKYSISEPDPSNFNYGD